MEIFVFGSNLAGRHGKGAALYARTNHGAKLGVGEGLTGMSYALPTKDARLGVRSLQDIKVSVDKFLHLAHNTPYVTFNVTRVGCGLAGYNDAEIAPMFKGAPSNCKFHDDWLQYIFS